jgi:hypothetical protein
MTKTRTLILSLTVVAVALTAGCSQKYSAERDGKKVGDAVCDLRDATTPEDAQAALDDLDNQLNDLGNKYAVFTAEDRADVQNNLADLHEHVIQGNDLLVNQDLAVLRRSVGNIAEDSDETTRAAWEGILEGLSSCTE